MFPTSKCSKCNDTVGHGPQCSSCKFKYHFKCGGISERVFGKLGSNRDSWLCPTCRDNNDSKTLDIGHSSSPTPTASGSSSGLPIERTSSPRPQSPSQISQDNILHDILAKVTDLQKQFLSLQTMESDLKQVKDDISDLKSALNTRIDGISHRVADIEQRMTSLDSIKTEVADLKKNVKDLMANHDRNEQWVRRSNIQFNGIPYKSGENLLHIIKRVADRCGFPLNVETDIDFITRVAVKNDVEAKKIKPIIVKLQSRYRKDDFLAAIRRTRNIKASDLGFSDSDNKIYGNDHLSNKNKQLLQQAKMKTKEKNYAYCWVRNCTVMVRRNEKSQVIHITSDEDLKKIT